MTQQQKEEEEEEVLQQRKQKKKKLLLFFSTKSFHNIGTDDVIIGLLTGALVVLLSVLITEEEVYAQQQLQEVVNSTYLHQYVLDDLENAELISVQVFQDGRMILVFKLSDESDRRMVIRTQSPLTPEAGYQWNNGTIYTKEGSKLVFELEGRERDNR